MTELDYATSKLAAQKQRIRQLERIKDCFIEILVSRNICVGVKENRCWYEPGEEDCRMCWLQEVGKANGADNG